MPITISINGKSNIYTTVDDQITLHVTEQDHVIIEPQIKVLRYLPIIGLCEENQAESYKRVCQ